MTFFRSHMTLIKWRISLFAALAAGLGYILKAQALGLQIIYPLVGVFVLAAGAGALNQYQERDLDARMERTRYRPLPSGSMTPDHALFIALTLILCGLCLLGLGSGLKTAGLGLFALAWYNGVYTCLKRLTAFAAVPGALVGAVPPVMGWTTAGGQINDVTILVMAFFFFIWQVPHFWALLLTYDDDYGRTGLPTLRGLLSRAQLIRMTIVWTTAAGVASLLIPLFSNHIHPASALGLAMVFLWLILGMIRLPNNNSRPFSPSRITLFMVFVMFFLSAGTLLG